MELIEIEIMETESTSLNPGAEWIVALEDGPKTVGEQSLADETEDATRQEDLCPNVNLSRGQVASQLLEVLDSRTVEGSEQCPDWLEERIDLPIYEDLSPLSPTSEPESYDWQPNTKPSAPMHLISLPLQELLGDAKPYVCSPPLETKDGIPKYEPEQTFIPDFITPVWTPPVPKVDALTPPDSPRDDDVDLLNNMLDADNPLLDNEPELCNELEELLRMTAENLVDDYKEASPAYSVPQSHSEDSSDSSHSVISSPSYSDSSSDDPEWVPRVPRASAPVPPTPAKKRRVAKPYSRPPPEDKKMRKKEQNKNAATRYRMKKKAEIEEVLVEEKELQERNDQLQHKVVELAREITYIKSLMRDFYKRSGLIK